MEAAGTDHCPVAGRVVAGGEEDVVPHGAVEQPGGLRAVGDGLGEPSDRVGAELVTRRRAR